MSCLNSLLINNEIKIKMGIGSVIEISNIKKIKIRKLLLSVRMTLKSSPASSFLPTKKRF